MNNPASPQLTCLPLRCFIVEDSPMILHHLIDTLEQVAPIKVVGTADADDEAMAWLGQNGETCDLLILDVFLKKGTGLHVLDCVKRLGLGTRKVVLSNYATPEIRRRCQDLGADRVFDKSSEVDELIEYCTQLAASAAPSSPA